MNVVTLEIDLFTILTGWIITIVFTELIMDVSSLFKKFDSTNCQIFPSPCLKANFLSFSQMSF